MRASTTVLSSTVAFVAVLSPTAANNYSPQSASSHTPQCGVVVSKLANPIYPPLARHTRITGDVKVSLGIRPDGSIESAVVISGHPLLQEAALDSARLSQFECRACTEPVTSFSLFYTFELKENPCPPDTRASSSAPPQEVKLSSPVIQLQYHVEIVGESVCIIDYAHKVRSAKCLYLWKCGWRM